MPYLLPSNLPGDDDISSVCVYYPNDPLFKSALLGALNFFTKWVAWERTQDNRASLASNLWYAAFERTLETWGNPCGDCQDMCTCEEIREIIKQELENMTIQNCITVNCGSGCGCGCSQTDKGVDTQPPNEEFPPVEPPPEVPIPTPEPDYLSFKCSMSYWLHYEYRNLLLKLQNLWEISSFNTGNVADAIDETLAQHNPLGSMLWVAYYQVVEWLVTTLTRVTVQELVSAWDSAQSLVVCALYGSDGTVDARERFLSVIDNLNLPWAARYWMRLLEQNIVYADWLYPENWNEREIPDTWRNRDCTSCQQPTDDPPQPVEGYFVIPQVIAGIAKDTTFPPENLISSYDGNEFEIEMSTSGNKYQQVAEVATDPTQALTDAGKVPANSDLIALFFTHTVAIPGDTSRHLTLGEMSGTNSGGVIVTDDSTVYGVIDQFADQADKDIVEAYLTDLSATQIFDTNFAGADKFKAFFNNANMIDPIDSCSGKVWLFYKETA